MLTYAILRIKTRFGEHFKLLATFSSYDKINNLFSESVINEEFCQLNSIFQNFFVTSGITSIENK